MSQNPCNVLIKDFNPVYFVSVNLDSKKLSSAKVHFRAKIVYFDCKELFIYLASKLSDEKCRNHYKLYSQTILSKVL